MGRLKHRYYNEDRQHLLHTLVTTSATRVRQVIPGEPPPTVRSAAEQMKSPSPLRVKAFKTGAGKCAKNLPAVQAENGPLTTRRAPRWSISVDGRVLHLFFHQINNSSKPQEISTTFALEGLTRGRGVSRTRGRQHMAGTGA